MKHDFLDFNWGITLLEIFFHVVVFSVMSVMIYPSDYRNSYKDLVDFYKAYLFGKYWQSVSYWFIPKTILYYE